MRTDGAARAQIGDYLLGLMDEAERAAFERNMTADAELRDAVDSFAAKLSSLDATASPANVPSGLWDKIAASIEETPQAQEVPAPVTRMAPASSSRSSEWRLGPAALAASLVAGIALGYGAGFLTIKQPQPVVMVVLDTPQNVPGAVFEAYADNSVRIVPLEDFVVPEGQIMQVWTLYDKAVGPVSLGTMTRSDVVTLGGHAFPVPAANQLYEITLEQAPGSPTGKPTGPILVKGFAKSPGV